MPSRSSRAIPIAPAYVRWMPSFWNQSLCALEAPAQSTRISSGWLRRRRRASRSSARSRLRRSDRFAQTTRWTPTSRSAASDCSRHRRTPPRGSLYPPTTTTTLPSRGPKAATTSRSVEARLPSNGQLTPTRRRQTATSMSTSRPLSTICNGSSFQITAVITESPITVRCGGAASPRTEAGAVAATAATAIAAAAPSRRPRRVSPVPQTLVVNPHSLPRLTMAHPGTSDNGPCSDGRCTLPGCRATPSGPRRPSPSSTTRSARPIGDEPSSSRAPTASWARISPTRSSRSARTCTRSCARPRAAR